MKKEAINIAGYLRISVDTEKDEDNTSIENQRHSIEMFVAREFPNAHLDFYTDRDRSGYTFEQREGYMELRPLLKNGTYDTLIVKDLSRFSRRNSRGLVELEDLRDCGARIIAINDGIDYPVQDDWTLIQFKFLMNEMPVTDTSKKVRKVIDLKQHSGDWICSVPFGYVMTNTKLGYFEIEPQAAEVVKKIFSLYLEGWGYKKIANYLTDEHIPTPRMMEKDRKIKEREKNANNNENQKPIKIKAKNVWAIPTIQGILQNDFYIGTLRQKKFKRSRINGPDVKLSEESHIVFENNHEAIIEYRTFATVQEQMKKRSTSHYRGVKKYDTSFSGFLYCGDCGSPMFSMSRGDLAPAYTCGEYHKRGRKACTSHHTRVDVLTNVLKNYVAIILKNSDNMLKQLEQGIKNEKSTICEGRNKAGELKAQLSEAKSELVITMRQKIKEIQKNPQNADVIEETYEFLITDLHNRIAGLEEQIDITTESENTIIKINRIARTAIDVFKEILEKDIIDKSDLDIIIERIDIYNDRIDIQLKSDIKMLLETGTISNELLPNYAPKKKAVNFKLDIESISKAKIVLKTPKHKDKALDVNVISNGDPLEIFTDREGEIILKKYSPIGEIGQFAGQYAESLAQATGYLACITDRDHVIAAAGNGKKDFEGKPISKQLEDAIEERKTILAEQGDSRFIKITLDDNGMYCNQSVSTIISEGDAIGAVILYNKDDSNKMGETENKLTATAAGFLGRQMEQ